MSRIFDRHPYWEMNGEVKISVDPPEVALSKTSLERAIWWMGDYERANLVGARVRALFTCFVEKVFSPRERWRAASRIVRIEEQEEDWNSTTDWGCLPSWASYYPTEEELERVRENRR